MGVLGDESEAVGFEEPVGALPSSPPDLLDLERFENLVREVEPRLRRALVAAFGPEIGREATADALAYAWEQRQRLEKVHNVAGYLYRVGQTSARRRRRAPAVADLAVEGEESRYEPKLLEALERLSGRQRLAVVLVHGLGWTPSEVAESTGLKRNTINNHLERGLRHLRAWLGVTDEQ